MTTNARRLTRLCWALLSFAGVGGCSSRTSTKPDPDPQKEIELKWARQIAKAFLQDVVAGKWESAAASTTEAYRKRDRSGTGFNTIMVEVDGDPRGHKRDQELSSFSFSEEELAPGHDEASFRGTLSGPDRVGTFSLRVVKEKESGKWRVDHFSTTLRKK
jgi:hypothetical protein